MNPGKPAQPLSIAEWPGPPAGVYACLVNRTCAGASQMKEREHSESSRARQRAL